MNFPPPPPPAAGPPPESTGDYYVPSPDELHHASMTHYLGAWLGVFGPMIYRSTSQPQSPHVRAHATASMNFQLTMLVYTGVATLLACCFGTAIDAVDRSGNNLTVFWILLFPLFAALTVWHITACCLAGSRARRGGWFEYRGTFHFLD